MSPASEAPPPDLTPESARFVAAIWRLNKSLGQALEPLLQAQPGMDPRTYFLLKTIQDGCVYPKTISDHLKIPPNLTSRYIEGLHKHGFIDRQIDRRDARRVRLTLTDTGTAAILQAEQTINTEVGTRLRNLTESQLHALLDALDTLAGADGPAQEDAS